MRRWGKERVKDDDKERMPNLEWFKEKNWAHRTLVCVGCANKISQTGRFIFLVHSSGGWESKLRASVDAAWGLLPGSEVAIFSLCPCVWEGQGALWVSFIGTLLLLTRAPLSRPDHFPKSPPPNAITWRSGFHRWILRGHKHSVYDNHQIQKRLETLSKKQEYLKM